MIFKRGSVEMSSLNISFAEWLVYTGCVKHPFNNSGDGSPHENEQKASCQHMSGNTGFPVKPILFVFYINIFSFKERLVICNGIKVGMRRNNIL